MVEVVFAGGRIAVCTDDTKAFDDMPEGNSNSEPSNANNCNKRNVGCNVDNNPLSAGRDESHGASNYHKWRTFHGAMLRNLPRRCRLV